MKKIIYLLIINIICINFTGCNLYNKSYTNKIEDYGNYKGSFYYDLVQFPEKEITVDNVLEFEYVYIESLLDDSQYVRLKYQFKEESYEKEKDRLKKIKDEYGTTKLNNNTFDLPAYVYLLNEGDVSEFVLTNDTKLTMEYVYIQGANDFDDELYVDKVKAEE